MIQYRNKWPLNTISDKSFLEGELCDKTISVKQLQSIRGQSLPKLKDSEYTMSYKAENMSHFECSCVSVFLIYMVN